MISHIWPVPAAYPSDTSLADAKGTSEINNCS